MNIWKKFSHLRKIIPLFTMGLILLGCEEPPPNNPPEISGLIIYPSQPKAGQLVTLTGVAEDEDGDDIRYKWVASGGTFLDSLGANPIQWQAPTISDTINIFLHVSDQDDNTIESKSFYLEPGLATLAGHVSDITSEHMLEGVVVNLNGTEVTTGSDGYFLFADILAGDNIPISATAQNYVTYAEFISVDVDENIIDISMTVLTEVGRIAGYISDSVTGEKIVGAIVQTGEITDTTETDGYYELYNVPISENVPVRATKDGYAIFANMVNVIAGYNTNNIDLVPNIATISGRITSEADQSLLEGVIVTINQYQDTTNAAGYFEIVDMPVTSNASVSAVLNGYITSYTTFDIVGGINNLNLSLSDNPGELTGWVRNTLDGSVISNISVTVGGTTVVTISDGSYLASGLEAGPTLITCSITGFDDFTDLIIINPGSNSLDIDMVQVTGSLTGFVVDSLENVFMSSVRIQLGSGITYSDLDGYYEFENVPVNELQLLVEETDYRPYSELYTLSAGENSHNIMLLPATGSVLGLVKDGTTGLILPEASVSIGDENIETDENGYFEFPSIDYGAQQVIRCEMENYSDFVDTLLVVYGENIYNIEMESSVATVHGVVTNSAIGMLLANVNISMGDSVVMTDASGYYLFEDVDLGSISIKAELLGYETQTIAIDVSIGENIVNISLNSDHGILIGNIIDHTTGLALDSVVIFVGADTVYSNSEGFYTLDSLALGDVDVEFEKDGYISQSEWVEIGRGDNVLDVSLSSSTGNLLGYIRDINTNNFLDSVMVYFGGDSVLTGVDGFYEFPDNPVEENAELRASKAGFLSYQEWVNINAGINTADINLTPIN